MVRQIKETLKDWLRSAWASSLAFMTIAGLTFLVVGRRSSGPDPLVPASTDDEAVTASGVPIEPNPVVDTTAWLAWKFAVALGVAVSLLLLVQGVRRLSALHKTHGVSGWAVAGHVLLALLLYLATFGFLIAGGSMDREWPVPHLEGTLDLVSLGIALGAVPWLALVWLTHGVLRQLRPPPGDAASLGLDQQVLEQLGEANVEQLRAREVDGFNLSRLTSLWQVVEGATRAFAVFVVISLVPTGALRLSWLAQGVLPKETQQANGEVQFVYSFCPAAEGAGEALKNACATLREDFPTLQVLLYGAFFAVVLVAITLPLLTSWRARARVVLEVAAPQDTIGSLDDEALRERRTRLESALRLDSGLLREPVSAIAVLTPLVSSLVAALLPELAA